MITNWKKKHLIPGLCKNIPALQWLTWSKRHIKHVQRERWRFSEEVEPANPDSCHDGLTGFEHEPPAWVAWQSVTLPMHPPPSADVCVLCYLSPFPQLTSKHETLIQCCFNVRPKSTTSAQHWPTLLFIFFPSAYLFSPDKSLIRQHYDIWNGSPANPWETRDVQTMLG